MRRFLVIGPPFLWLLMLFLVPFVIVLKISLSDIATAIPPYTPTLDISGGWPAIRSFFAGLDLENFVFLTTDDLYWKAYLSSLKIATTECVEHESPPHTQPQPQPKVPPGPSGRPDPNLSPKKRTLRKDSRPHKTR